jgi:GNAT superfamily N-acetyltransferase
MRIDSVHVIPVSKFPNATETAMEWILKEWGPREGEGEEEFRSCVNGETGHPEAIVAVLSGEPVGTVAFRRHDLLQEESNVLWVNALYVLPEMRRNRIGATLIQHAEQVAAQTDETLYAFTDIPEFYEALDWVRYYEDKKFKNWIVLKSLARDRI